MLSILSINSAAPRTLVFNNQEVATGIFKEPVTGSVRIGEQGLSGDTIVDTRVHGGLDQAVYLYHKEDYDWWAQQLGRPLPNGIFGENLTLEGMDEVNWVIGDRLRINDVLLEITAPRTPCFKLGVRMEDPRFIKQFVKANRPGAYARVLNPGSVSVGDTIEVSRTPEDHASVKEVFTLMHTADKSREMLSKALASPLAEVHRSRIQGWYAELE